jgi:hypothetical protein
MIDLPGRCRFLRCEIWPHVDIDLPARGARAASSGCAVCKPKKRWPFQLVPVIAFATCDRLRYDLPFQANPLSRITTLSSLPFHSRTSSAPALRLAPSPRRRNASFKRPAFRPIRSSAPLLANDA